MNKRRTKNQSSSLEYRALEKRQLLAAITVDTAVDNLDSTDGFTSLREAILEANSNNEDDTIQITVDSITIASGGRGEDLGASGDFDIRSDDGHSIRISGLSAGGTEIIGANDRIFDINPDSDVILANLNLSNGRAFGVDGDFKSNRGGAIFSNEANLELSQVSFQNNRARVEGAALFFSGR